LAPAPFNESIKVALKEPVPKVFTLSLIVQILLNISQDKFKVFFNSIFLSSEDPVTS